MTSTPGLIYIGGMLRSGTTLLAQLLGNISGCLAAGELRLCWAVFAANTPCSCGHPARECPVWSAALREAFGADSGIALYERYAEQANRVLRPRLALSAGRAGLRADFEEYRGVMERLVRAASLVEDASYVIDASKSGTDFLFWTDSTIPVHLVHIYRQPMAVAYSEARRVKWPADVERYAPPSRPLAKSAARWSLSNAYVSAVSHRAESYTLIRYEDLISDPAAALQRITQRLPGLEDVIIDRVETSERGHILAGNPSAFSAPVIRKPDDSWKRDLSSAEKATITALTMPVAAALHTRRHRLAAAERAS